MNGIHNKAQSALIVGAGVAGLTTATQLARSGWEVTVLERSTALRTGGYKIDVRGAALGVLDRIGLIERARAHHLGIRSGSIVTADGTTVAQMGGDTFGGRAGADIELERGDLVSLLAETAISAGAMIRTGARAESVDDDGVHLDSGEIVGADFVIGADGLHSAVRSAVLGEADVIRDLGYGIAVHETTVQLGLEREEMTYVSAGRTALIYDTGTCTRAMYLFSRTGSIPRDRAGAEDYLRESYAGQGWRVPELLAGLQPEHDLYLDAIAQVVAPAWSRGTTVLVGDAAWCASPASGQGTSLALVGGFVLASRLAADPSEHGLIAYEQALRPFVQANQKLGPANIKRMVLCSDKAVRSTLSMLRVTNRLPFSDALMGLAMRPLHRAANAVDLSHAAQEPGRATA